jgi:hypothetical protein
MEQEAIRSAPRRLSPFMFAASLTIALCGCEPSSSVGFTKNFAAPVDLACLEKALRSVSQNVVEGTYISEGDDGFPTGTQVMQFSYQDAGRTGGYTLGVGPLPGGQTHFYNKWSKVGRLRSPDMTKATTVLLHSNSAIETICGISMAGISQDVQGLR